MTSTGMFIRGLALIAALTAFGSGAQAEILFRGSFQITAVNAACTEGPSAGSIENAQFHPRGLGNDNVTALTTIWTFGGNSFKLEGASFTKNFQPVISEGLGWSVYTKTKKASILLDPVPTIETNTNALVLTGKIKNISGNEGQENCIANFRAVLYKVVE